MSKMLFDEAPLVIDTILAQKIGLNEAIVLQQIHYWIEVNRKKNTNFYDGCFWTYNSIKKWNEFFPFYGEKTLKRIFNTLEKSGLIISNNFNKAKMDRTKWYTIDYDKLNQIVNGQVDPMQELKKENAKGQNDPMQRDKMTQPKGQNDPMQGDKMTQPIPEITTETSTEITTETSTTSKEDEVDENVKNVFNFFENNFYLPKQYDCELMAGWCERYLSNLIIEAMKVAKKNNARSLAYIDRILINWEAEGITTLDALENYNQAKERGMHNASNRRDSSKGSDNDPYGGIGLEL